MHRSPPDQTAFGRNSSPPLAQLESKLQYSISQLEYQLRINLDSDSPPDEGYMRNAKSSLGRLWTSYDSTYQQVIEGLRKVGATEEISNHKTTYANFIKQCKHYSTKMRWHLVACGNEQYSTIDGLSDFTSVSKMTVGRRQEIEEMIRVAIAHKEAKQSLIEIETKERILDAQQRRVDAENEEKLEIEKCKLSMMKIAIEQDEKVNILKAKLDDANTEQLDNKDYSLTKNKDTSEWVNASVTHPSVPNDHTINRSSQMLSTNIQTNNHPTVTFATTGSYRVQSNHSKRLNQNIYSNHHNVPATSMTNLPPTSFVRTQHNTDPSRTNNTTFDVNAPLFEPSLNPRMDPGSRHLALAELKRAPSSPFYGEAYHFQSWWSSLEARILPLNPTALDIIDVLEAHTSGAPHELIKLYKSIQGSNPGVALNIIKQKLQVRFGDRNEVSSTLRKKLTLFPIIKGTESSQNVATKLRQLSDLCLLIQAHMNSTPDLQTLNFSSGLEEVRRKMPDFLNNRWRSHKQRYIRDHGEHPPFFEFCNFVEQEADTLCADSFFDNEIFTKPYTPEPKSVKPTQWASKALLTDTETSAFITSTSEQSNHHKCPLHRSQTHDLKECYAFKQLDVKTRRLLVSSYQLCFRCMGHHLAKECTKDIKCDICHLPSHLSFLHLDDRANFTKRVNLPKPAIATEERRSGIGSGASASNNHNNTSEVTTLQTTNTKDPFGRSCGKTLLVDISSPQLNKTVRAYAIIDEQSNQSFATSSLFNEIGIHSPLHNYTLTTLSNSKFKLCGRVSSNLFIKGVSETKLFPLPPLFENDGIPNTKGEVATPEMVESQEHLSHLANNFLKLDNDAEVCLLLGRDAGDILATKMETTSAPFAHHTSLGWAVVGSMCPTEASSSSKFLTLRTHLDHDHFDATLGFPKINNSIFTRFSDDEYLSSSIEDKKFLNIVTNNMTTTAKGNLQMPLPFRNENISFPSNHDAVQRRQRGTLQRLKSDSFKLGECTSFMNKLISSGHVEKVPTDEITGRSGLKWYLPVFPVIHPKKRKVRLVFDSAASYSGVSLNSTLLQGPDQNNQLYEVLLRFREREVAFVADIESMYHCFYVPPHQRDFLRFFWFDNNDPERQIVEYRAKVHIFGNCSSPAVAIVGLRKAAECLMPLQENSNKRTNNIQAHRYLTKGFYVDDGLGSTTTADEAINVLSTAKTALATYNIRLHKILSNDKKVMNAFSSSEVSHQTVEEVLIDAENLHRTLGVSWDVIGDHFTFKVDIAERPFTKRGVLSIVNSIFDPIGFASPVILGGRILQRSIMNPKDTNNTKYEWDDPLPVEHLAAWRKWMSSLEQLEDIKLSRCYLPANFGSPHIQTLHVFSDASKDAIGHVIYLRSVNQLNEIHVAFVTGDSKVAPRNATSIPRLELCASVGAAQAANYIKRNLSYNIDETYFYTDSNVTLAYIKNEHRRFTKYVSRRVGLIHNFSCKDSWDYIPSTENPADHASRALTAKILLSSSWLSGPDFLWNTQLTKADVPYEQPNELPECEDLVLEAVALAIVTDKKSPLEDLFLRVNNWTKLVRITRHVLSYIRKLSIKASARKDTQERPKFCTKSNSATNTLIKDAQSSSYHAYIKTMNSGHNIPTMDKLSKLCPFLDHNGIMRVGGRLKHSDLTMDRKHPIVLPHNHPISNIILSHYHTTSGHQGRHITNGSVRDAGYFLEKGAKAIKEFIYKCITCCKLRKSCTQLQMADLPHERITASSPFLHTGLDVMGPWKISDGPTTRRRHGEKKMWAVLFTCLASRAVHVELLPSLDTTSMKNSLRRFIAIRGQCKVLRSDRGTNFIAANKEINLEQLSETLNEHNCQWIFNPPHASHFGGVWERKIGQIKRALDYSIFQLRNKLLSMDELNTLMQEAAAIVNSTPMWEISNDPNDPIPLSPSMLLTLREQNDVDCEEFTEEDMNSYGRKRWRRVQYLSQQFWTKWKTYYLQELQTRQKWITKTDSLSEGDVVFIREKTAPRKFWNMGIIMTVKLSHDNTIRSATIKQCKTRPDKTVFCSIIERPITELVLLIKRNK